MIGFPITRRLFSDADGLNSFEVNQLLDFLQQMEAQRPPANQTVGIGPYGQPLDLKPRGFWGRLTGARRGHLYAWVRAVPTIDGAVTSDGADANRDEGTPDAWPAIEVNRNAEIPPGTVVWLEPGDGAFLNFGHCCGGYPYQSGPYGTGGGGSFVRWESGLHLTCDPTDGVELTRVRYQLLLQAGRISLSMEVLPPDIMPTTCKEIIKPGTVVLTCVDNVPRLTFDTEKIRVINCVACP